MNSQSLNTYKYITSAATTTFVGETTRVILGSININKTLTGTLTVKAGTVTIGIFAIGTLPGCYWRADDGTEVESLTLVNSATDNITVFYRNI